VPELTASPQYLYDHLTTWSKKFVFNFGIDFSSKVIVVQYKLAGLLSTSVVGALVEDS
jgi:hypothetical protein